MDYTTLNDWVALLADQFIVPKSPAIRKLGGILPEANDKIYLILCFVQCWWSIIIFVNFGSPFSEAFHNLLQTVPSFTMNQDQLNIYIIIIILDYLFFF